MQWTNHYLYIARAVHADPQREFNGPVIRGRQKIPLSYFPGWYDRHRKCVRNTPELENLGARLIAENFENDNNISQFISGVCCWGNYPGIAGRVLQNNNPTHIADCFRRAVGAESPTKAMMFVNRIWGLGQNSFASKHLRMLKPDRFPVLDSILVDNLNIYIYSSFCGTCLSGANTLNNEGIVCPTGNTWRVADVESAIFACLAL